MLVVRGSAPLRPSDPISTSKLIRYFVAEWHDLDTLHGRRAPYAPGKIYLYAGRVGLGICKPYHTRPGSGGKLRFYTVVVEHDRIAVYAGPLPVMRKPAAIAAFRIIFSAFECFGPTVGITRKLPRSPYHPTPLIWVKLNPSMVLWCHE